MRPRLIPLALCALLLLAAASVGGAQAPAPYARADWPHWAASDAHPCRDVRQEVLVRDGTGVTFDDPETECRVADGRWWDPYTGTELRLAQVDVDHVVPLRWAHEHGGAAWTPEQRRAYANDLAYPWHLLAVSARENRSKGARGPAGYFPPRAAVHCMYAHAWAAILVAWDLHPGAPDRAALRLALERCRRRVPSP